MGEQLEFIGYRLKAGDLQFSVGVSSSDAQFLPAHSVLAPSMRDRFDATDLALMTELYEHRKGVVRLRAMDEPS